MRHHRIERLIEARNLEEVPAGDAEVAGIWAAALREWSDAGVPGLSLAGTFTHIYQAAFRAASALLRAAGYRTRGAVGSHHYVTFYAVSALGDDEMEQIADALQGIRGGRHIALYGDEEELELEDVENARAHVSLFLYKVHRWLTTSRPLLADRFGTPPSQSE